VAHSGKTTDGIRKNWGLRSGTYILHQWRVWGDQQHTLLGGVKVWTIWGYFCGTHCVAVVDRFNEHQCWRLWVNLDGVFAVLGAGTPV